MNMKHVRTAWGIFLLCGAFNSYADSALRIKCFDDAEGAEVYINSEFKTNCPASVFVPAGDVRVLIRKSVDQDHERVFTQQMRLGDGAVATIEARLSAARLTADATRRKQIAEAQQTLEKARSGDIAAMREMSNRYKSGTGVEASPAESAQWLQKAEEAGALQLLREAEAGNLDSMEALAKRYDTGNGIGKDPEKAGFWRNKKQGLEQQALAKKRETDKAARIKAIEDKKYSNTKDFFADMFMQSKKGINPLTATSLTFYSPLFVPSSLLTDWSELPAQKAEIEKIRKEAAVLPARWAAPDSMIAQANR
jgi:hypothetical protein